MPSCAELFACGASSGDVSVDENNGIVVTLPSDAEGTVEITVYVEARATTECLTETCPYETGTTALSREEGDPNRVGGTSERSIQVAAEL